MPEINWIKIVEYLCNAVQTIPDTAFCFSVDVTDKKRYNNLVSLTSYRVLEYNLNIVEDIPSVRVSVTTSLPLCSHHFTAR